MVTGITTNIYQEIAERTGGGIYLGVVGPVRTGKSTFVKRVMEELVIPNIKNIYQKERAKDELPQSGSGRTIMTSEPKFLPEEAVEISPDETSALSVRLIDSVGYVIPGALGVEEEGRPRMVTTPWFPNEIPMPQAAEIGTKKIMEEHCSVGVVITTDGSINDIPREDFVQAEQRAIEDMKATGKPFIVLINSMQPEGHLSVSLKEKLENDYNVRCLCVDCLKLQIDEILDIFSSILQEFPVSELQIYLPGWFSALPETHELKVSLFERLISCAKRIAMIAHIDKGLQDLMELDGVESFHIQSTNLGNGVVQCRINICEELYYKTLSDTSGFEVSSDADLMKLLTELAVMKRAYDKIETALQQVQATGYGIVMPSPDEMRLEIPQIVRKGSNYGVRLKASAPSIHMMRADIQTEINPIVGDEKQSEELLQYLLKEYEDNTEKLWESNIFGKSVYELINEGLGSKLKRMPEEARFKLQSTLSRIINEGSSGLLCIIFA